jgi:hypothetical protein
METLRDYATDEFMEKVNNLTNPLHIRIIDRILETEYLGKLSYLDATCIRDIFDIDINWLALHFSKKI